MPPQNPNPQNNAAYDFFLKDEKPKRTFGGGPTSTKGRIFVVAAGFFILLIIIIIFVSSLSGGKTPNLLKVAQDQNEIVRISTAGALKAAHTSTKQFAITTQLSVGSAQTDLLAYLKKNGVKYSPKQLGLTHSLTTDQQLTSAAAASLYDQTYDSIMKSQLQTYSSDLKVAFTATHAAQLRTLLNNDYKGAQLLLTQVADDNN